MLLLRPLVNHWFQNVMIYGSLFLLTGDSQHQVLGRQIKEMSTEKKEGISQRKYVGRHFADGKWKIYLKVPLKTF